MDTRDSGFCQAMRPRQNPMSQISSECDREGIEFSSFDNFALHRLSNWLF
ncbi:MAG: hypothetical protein JWM85_3571 [Acidimicrobiaceae bacterium]|nr:hypothetical protein [Acidimicrobiaceae bacterium]